MRKYKFRLRSPLEVGDVVLVRLAGDDSPLETRRVEDIYTVHSARTGQAWFRYVMTSGEVVSLESIECRNVNGKLVRVGTEECQVMEVPS